MASNAIFELSQMEMSWRHEAATGRHPSDDGVRSTSTTVKSNYQVAKEDSHLGCLRYNITEQPSEFPGGASFYVESEGESTQICTVENFFEGRYYVLCPRPSPGSCAVTTIYLEWEHFKG